LKPFSISKEDIPMDFENDYDDYEDFEGDDDFTPWDDAQSEDRMPDESGCDTFTATDAFFIGGAMGWAYEEGLNEKYESKKKRKRKRDDYDDFI
jgi:hypothetical protein